MDEEAGQTYEKYADELIHFATALVGPSGGEDILADAMLRVFSSPAWKTVTNKRAYLYRAVMNEALQSKRSIARRLRREAAAAAATVAEEDRFHEADILDTLRRLTVRQRAVVYLTYWVGHDAAEIARALDMSTRTVERELAAARHHLEVLLR